MKNHSENGLTLRNAYIAIAHTIPNMDALISSNIFSLPQIL